MAPTEEIRRLESSAEANELLTAAEAVPRRTLLERISTARLERKLRTPDRALAQIEKLETADGEELGVAVTVTPAPRGRVTGFLVECEEHGPMPVLAPSRKAGHLAAARHVLHEHNRKGTVVLKGLPKK